jgi:SPX domain protein involved in polyphosphate accumulation
VPVEYLVKIRDAIAPFTEHDAYARMKEDHKYTVRSIYLDSPSLDFYYEKIDGLKIRRKLRLRTYNQPDDKNVYFIEIKRRHSDRVAKERVRIPEEYLEMLIIERINPNGQLRLDRRDERILGKVLYNLIQKDLSPVVLVTYEREAMVGQVDKRLRITFDQSLRCQSDPKLNEIFSENKMISVYDNVAVLEIKFDHQMPTWLRKLIRTIPMYKKSVSKYCLGIDKAKINEPIYTTRIFRESTQYCNI